MQVEGARFPVFTRFEDPFRHGTGGFGILGKHRTGPGFSQGLERPGGTVPPHEPEVADTPFGGGQQAPTERGAACRDPHVCKWQDQYSLYYTAVTKQGKACVARASSKDLINWSAQKFLPVMEHEPSARNCWAPEITWDPAEEHYVIYWATTIPEQFTETAKAGDNGWNHRMYCTTTKDFRDFTKTRLFYNPGFNVIDSTIFRGRDRYVMVTSGSAVRSRESSRIVRRCNRARGYRGGRLRTLLASL